MFPNTGNLSFYLGIGFILMTLIGFFAVAYLSFSEKIDQTRLQSIIDLGKWVLTSVAIVVGASIVSDGFKERDQDIKEFGIFDKYVQTVTAADGIEIRWLLAEYFSIVAPQGELRRSWQEYKKNLEPQLSLYRSQKEEIRTTSAKQDKTVEDVIKIAQLKESTAVLEQSLLPAPVTPAIPATAGNWAIIAASDQNLDQAKTELAKAQRINPAAQLYKKGNFFITVVPSFKTRDAAAARLGEVKAAVRDDAYIVDADKLCTKLDVAGGYLICG